MKNIKEFKNYINTQFKLAWDSSYFVNQSKQIWTIFILSSFNFINRLGVSFILLLMIYILSKLNITNSDYSNLRWTLIGTLASTIATIIVLDAYNRYIKFDSFGKWCGRNIYNIFFRLTLTVHSLSYAFIKDYNSNNKQFSTNLIDKELILRLKEELNNPHNLNFINTNNLYFEVLPDCYNSINNDIARITDVIIPNILIYADNKDFINSITFLADELEVFLNIVKIQAEAVKRWYPNRMHMAPTSLGDTTQLINSLNIIFDNILKFLENNKRSLMIINKFN